MQRSHAEHLLLALTDEYVLHEGEGGQVRECGGGADTEESSGVLVCQESMDDSADGLEDVDEGGKESKERQRQASPHQARTWTKKE